MRLSAAKLGTALAECLSVQMPSPVRVYMEELTRESLEETTTSVSASLTVKSNGVANSSPGLTDVGHNGTLPVPEPRDRRVLTPKHDRAECRAERHDQVIGRIIAVGFPKGR